jgi:hypothetical protein
MPKKLDVNWSRTRSANFDNALKRYGRYLEEQGFRDSTVEEYAGNAGRYLRFVKTDRPSLKDYKKFRESLHE